MTKEREYAPGGPLVGPIVSFGWTAPAVYARAKDTTRRDWKDRNIALYKKGRLFQAWTKVAYAGGRGFAQCRVLEDCVRESTALLPPEDWIREGFAWLGAQGRNLDNGVRPLDLWTKWRVHPEDLAVLRFEILDLVGEPIL